MKASIDKVLNILENHEEHLSIALRQLNTLLQTDDRVSLCLQLLPDAGFQQISEDLKKHTYFQELCDLIYVFSKGRIRYAFLTHKGSRYTSALYDAEATGALSLTMLDLEYLDLLCAVVWGNLEHTGYALQQITARLRADNIDGWMGECGRHPEEIQRQQKIVRNMVRLVSVPVTINLSPEPKTMTNKATPLQKAMLLKIAESECTSVNGAPPDSPEETLTWAETIIETPQDQGVFTSLLNAGLVMHSGGPKREATVRLTSEGFKVYKAL